MLAGLRLEGAVGRLGHEIWVGGLGRGWEVEIMCKCWLLLEVLGEEAGEAAGFSGDGLGEMGGLGGAMA